MKKVKKRKETMLSEYDFRGGERGRYANRYAEGTNIVLVEPDVAKFFPTAYAVNKALRALAEIIKQRSSHLST